MDDLWAWIEFEGVKDEVDCSKLRNVSQLRRAIKSAFEIQRAAPYIQVQHHSLGVLNPETSMSIALSEGGGDSATPLVANLVDGSGADGGVGTAAGTDPPKDAAASESPKLGRSSPSPSPPPARDDGSEDTAAKRKRLNRTPSKIRIPRVFKQADASGAAPPMPNVLSSPSGSGEKHAVDIVDEDGGAAEGEAEDHATAGGVKFVGSVADESAGEVEQQEEAGVSAEGEDKEATPPQPGEVVARSPPMVHITSSSPRHMLSSPKQRRGSLTMPAEALAPSHKSLGSAEEEPTPLMTERGHANRLDDVMGQESDGDDTGPGISAVDSEDDDDDDDTDDFFDDESEFTMSEMAAVQANEKSETVSDELSDGEGESESSVGDEAARRRAKMTEKRTKVAREVLETEEKYVGDLDTIIRKYLQPMQAQAKNPSGGLKEQEVKDIFGNIKTIYGGNQLLLKDIQERLSDWDVNKTQLGDIFIRMSPWFKVYIQYVTQYNKARELLKTLMMREAFSTFLGLLESGNMSNNSLRTYLIMPVQRIPRYIMLVKDLLKDTWEDHPDYENLGTAIVKLEEIARELEDKQNQHINIHKVMEIQQMLTCKKGTVELVQPGRGYVRDGKVSIAEKGAGTLRSRHAFLFSDLLIICRPATRGMYQMKERIKLSSLSGVKKTDKGIHVAVTRKERGKDGRKELVRTHFVMTSDGGSDEKEWLDDLVLQFTKVMMHKKPGNGRNNDGKPGRRRSNSLSPRGERRERPKSGLLQNIGFGDGPLSSPMKRRRHRSNTATLPNNFSSMLRVGERGSVGRVERKRAASAGSAARENWIKNPIYGNEKTRALRPSCELLREHPRLQWPPSDKRLADEAALPRSNPGTPELEKRGSVVKLSIPLGDMSEQPETDSPRSPIPSPSPRRGSMSPKPIQESPKRGNITPRRAGTLGRQ